MPFSGIERLSKTSAGRVVTEYLEITVGALLIAMAVDVFLTPNRVVCAGVTGLGQLAMYMWGWPIGVTTLALNIPLLAAGLKWGGGWRMVVRTMYAVIVMSAGIDLLEGWITPVTGDALVFTLFGGLLDGAGIGLVLRARGTTGGTDILAQLLYKFKRISFGTVFLWSNTLILLGAVPVVGLSSVLQAIIVNYISSSVVDAVQEGLGYARAFFIFSRNIETVKKAILDEIGRGVTIFEAKGGYSGEERPAIYVVVSRAQSSGVKRLIADVDPHAFVVVTAANEVLGEGFRPVSEN